MRRKLLSVWAKSKFFTRFFFRHALDTDLKDANLNFWTAHPHVFLVAVDKRDNSVVGTIAIQKKSEDTCEINRTSVRKDARKYGIGRKLVEAITQEAKRKGFDNVYLETSSAQKSAIRLYDRVGFKKVGVEDAGNYLPFYLPFFIHSISILKFLYPIPK